MNINDTIFCQNAREILQNITLSEIVDRIALFRKVDLKKISDSELNSEIDKVFKVNVSGEYKSVLLNTSIIIGENQMRIPFSRIRSLTDEDIKSKTFVSMKNEEDAWWPNKDYVSRNGRINKKYESLLYVTDTILTAIKEKKIKIGNPFYYIEYLSKKAIRACIIGEWKSYSGLNETENLKLKLYNDYLISEFSKDVGIGTEYLYRTSEIIAKKYFDQKDVQDAWCYSSIANKGGGNYCFYPYKAKECLELVGVRCCKLQPNEKFGVVCDAIPDSIGNLLYYSPKSEFSKKTFALMNAFLGI